MSNRKIQEFVERERSQEIEYFLRLPDVVELTGLPESSVYEQIADGTFPRPVPISRRGRAWLSSEIRTWQKARIAERDAERAA